MTDLEYLKHVQEPLETAIGILKESNDQAAKRPMDQLQIEDAIMKMPGLGYIEAFEMLACFQSRLEHRYDNQYSSKVERLFGELRQALENAREPDDPDMLRQRGLI